MDLRRLASPQLIIPAPSLRSRSSIWTQRHQRVTFLYLEFEDLFIVMGLAAVMNIVGRFLGRDLYGVPLNIVLQYVVPVEAVPVLMLFKYGKPRRYVSTFPYQ